VEVAMNALTSYKTAKRIVLHWKKKYPQISMWRKCPFPPISKKPQKLVSPAMFLKTKSIIIDSEGINIQKRSHSLATGNSLTGLIDHQERVLGELYATLKKEPQTIIDQGEKLFSAMHLYEKSLNLGADYQKMMHASEMLIKLLLDSKLPQNFPILPKQRLEKAFSVANFIENYELSKGMSITEAKYTLLVRGLVNLQEECGAQKAMELLLELRKKGTWLRMRTLSPLFSFAVQKRNEKLVLDLWSFMKASQNTNKNSKETDQEVKDSILGIGFHKEQFLEILEFYAQISPQNLPHIFEDLKEHFNPYKNSAAVFQPLSLFELKSIFNGQNGRPAAQLVDLDKDANFLCPACGSFPSQEHLLALSSHDKKVLRSRVMQLVQVTGGPRATESLQKLHKLLHSSKAGRYTVVIDGGNVGFYDSNAIDVLRKQLEAEGERVLIIAAYSTRYDKRLIQEWKSAGVFFQSYNWEVDDWFWVYATIAYDDHLVHLVSNDMMRDHVFYFTSKLLSRFRATHVVHFHPRKLSKEDDKFILLQPEKLPREIHEFQPGKWHFPDLLQENEKWLCLDISKSCSTVRAQCG